MFLGHIRLHTYISLHRVPVGSLTDSSDVAVDLKDAHGRDQSYARRTDKQNRNA